MSENWNSYILYLHLFRTFYTNWKSRVCQKTEQPQRHYSWAASWQNQQSGMSPSEDSNQPGHPPSLIKVSAVRKKKVWVLSYPLSAQRRLWSDWADAQVNLSLRWAHSHFVGFVMRRLSYYIARASAQSDQSLRCPHEESLGPKLPTGRTAKTLIRWAHSHFVGFVMRRLSYYIARAS